MSVTKITGRFIEALRWADWLSRDRITAWGLMLLVAELLLSLFIALWQHGVFTRTVGPHSIDFLSFYAAGKLALTGAPQLAYDQAAHYLAEQHIAGTAAPYQFFFYPPVFLLLCAALAKLPYLASYVVFQLAGMIGFVLAMRPILRRSDWHWVLPVLAFPAVIWSIGLGQNAPLTAGLLACFTVLIDKRPIAAGLMLGLLCYKPHFGLLMPIALIAGQRWRTFFAAGATVVTVVLLSRLVYGWETWAAYLTAFGGSHNVYASGRIDYAKMISLFGGARLLGFDAAQAYAVQGVAAVAMACLLAVTWRHPVSQPVRNAMLLTTTLLAVPVALIYDQLLLIVAAGWLTREARATGYLPWERLCLIAIYPMALLAWPIGTAWHVPLGCAGPAVILLLCLRRSWSALAMRNRPAPISGGAQPAGAIP
ncbi:MAG TPA: glycosyltransferase family 87 protein [Acetobacteraceae bacterium]|nr:glycosyltransferase family 87 protein [Acetobacteraceae bacterium]